MLAVDAIKRAGSTDPKAINEALANTKNFEGVTGNIQIDEWHNAIKSAAVLEIQDGKIVNSIRVNP